MNYKRTLLSKQGSTDVHQSPDNPQEEIIPAFRVEQQPPGNDVLYNSWYGIAKLFSSGRMEPDPCRSGSHLAGIVGPEAERISPCMTIGVGGEAIAAWFESGVDLVMGGEEPLCLPG